MAKMTGKPVAVSSYIGKSADKHSQSGKSPSLMAGSTKPASSLGNSGGITKPSTTKHGSGFIARAKTAL